MQFQCHFCFLGVAYITICNLNIYRSSMLLAPLHQLECAEIMLLAVPSDTRMLIIMTPEMLTVLSIL